MNDFRREPEELRNQEQAAIQRVLGSGWFILGQELKVFEKDWARFCGTNHAVGVGNGLEALELGLRVLDIGAGDEVITTPITAMATVLAIIRAGAVPVLADISPDTALLDVASAERLISPRTKAILLVHLYGQVPPMDRWIRFCHEHELHLLEDCAQAHGARWDRKMAGTFGTWGAYSFYPTKNLGAKGDAGALITDSAEIADRVRRLRNYGQKQRYEHCEFGMNSRLDELQAAILSVRLGWLTRFNQRRREIAASLQKAVNNPLIELPSEPFQPDAHVHHLFVIRCDQRERLADFLQKREIETFIHYPRPIHTQPACAVFQRVPLPHAENHAERCLSIPCHPQLCAEELRQIAAALNDFR